MTRRFLGGVLVLLGLLIGLGFPVSVWRAGDRFVAEIERMGDLDVLDRDQRGLSLFWDHESDVASVTVKLTSNTARDHEQLVRQAMTNAGFSNFATVSRAGERFYHARTRADSLDADLYRIAATYPANGTAKVGVTFFDTDGLILAPYAGVVGLMCIALGCALTVRRRPHGNYSEPALAQPVHL